MLRNNPVYFNGDLNTSGGGIMTDLIHNWLSAVIYTGIVCSVVMMITPAGRVKKVLSILCGVAMCFAVISPIADFDFASYSQAMAHYRINAEQYAGNGAEHSKNLNRTIIEDECRAYILDKATEIGAELETVEVIVSWSSEGYWYPTGVEICAQATPQQKQALTSYIEAQLGIGSHEQKWSECK